MRTVLLVLALSVVLPAFAAPEWVGAKVVKLEPEKSRVTLHHEKIKSLPMEAMTMPFKVESPAMLTKLKVGQKVRFTVADKDGHLIITALELAR
ncbi:MAG TPA: copper-binding protein [Rubrivivax sp.]|nr:copper-binding protein [Rubrivivax sp.]